MIRKYFILFFVVFMAGCAKPPVFEQYVEMEGQVWNRFDFLFFEMPVQENQLYDFYFDVWFTEDYPWNDIELNITFYESGGSMRSADYTFDFDKSESNTEAVFENKFTIIKGMQFGSAGICKIRVENKMHKMQTPGIKKVGLVARLSDSD